MKPSLTEIRALAMHYCCKQGYIHTLSDQGVNILTTMQCTRHDFLVSANNGKKKQKHEFWESITVAKLWSVVRTSVEKSFCYNTGVQNTFLWTALWPIAICLFLHLSSSSSLHPKPSHFFRPKKTLMRLLLFGGSFSALDFAVCELDMHLL